jgi:hypothetical protein
VSGEQGTPPPPGSAGRAAPRAGSRGSWLSRSTSAGGALRGVHTPGAAADAIAVLLFPSRALPSLRARRRFCSFSPPNVRGAAPLRLRWRGRTRVLRDASVALATLRRAGCSVRVSDAATTRQP